MIIYIVQLGDTIQSIAEIHGVSVEKIIQENGIKNPFNLVPGQAIVIAYPEQTHIVQQGDTLGSIASAYQITLMQLLRNNPFISDRTNIFPGETLVISYNTNRQIMTNGYAYPYISIDTLKKTLPSLTYLSIYNYKADRGGEIIAYDDDSTIIQLAKTYGVIPLMMIATLTSRGEPDLEVGYELLLNQETQDYNIQNTLNILKERGYYGVNMVFSYISPSNLDLYKNLIARVSKVLREEGFIYFITINPSTSNVEDIMAIDYSDIEPLVDGIILTKFVWGSNTAPPAPVSSAYYIAEYVKHLLNYFPGNMLETGIPIIGYEWELPYIEGRTIAKSLNLDSVISLASEVGATIQFDDVSQTPYFEYSEVGFLLPTQYIVWFTDARSIDAMIKIINEYELSGIGVWNIMLFYPQFWLVVNSQFDVIKLIPDSIT